MITSKKDFGWTFKRKFIMTDIIVFSLKKLYWIVNSKLI